MVFICAVGMDWEAKAQNLLIAIISIAIVNFIAGTIRGPTSDEERAQGFEGVSWALFKQNFNSDYRFSEHVNQNFFSVFAIYFPSVTGIQAGANICGDLKNPAKSIPKGTMLALLISTTAYALFCVLAGAGAVRDASGSLADLHNGTLSSCVANFVSDLFIKL